jgi:hypothetical protein
MREKVELASKIIGLVIVCSCIVSCIALFYMIIFLKSDYSQAGQLFKISGLPYDKLTQNFLYSMHSLEKQLLVKMIFLSLITMPFGLYLMRPGNILIRWSFPETEMAVGEPDIFNDNEMSEENHFGLNKDESDDISEFGKCPECHRDLIKRRVETGKHAGKLYLACENYPRCKRIYPYKPPQPLNEGAFRL